LAKRALLPGTADPLADADADADEADAEPEEAETEALPAAEAEADAAEADAASDAPSEADSELIAAPSDEPADAADATDAATPGVGVALPDTLPDTADPCPLFALGPVEFFPTPMTWFTQYCWFAESIEHTAPLSGLTTYRMSYSSRTCAL
jgi:hypothetical protein